MEFLFPLMGVGLPTARGNRCDCGTGTNRTKVDLVL
jgi:hypothetical protein